MVCAPFPNYSRYHTARYNARIPSELGTALLLRFVAALATLTKHATKYTTTPIGAWICLPPEAVRCQRRATTSTTPLTNPNGRAVLLRVGVEPTFVMMHCTKFANHTARTDSCTRDCCTFERRYGVLRGVCGWVAQLKAQGSVEAERWPRLLVCVSAIDPRCARYGRQPLGAVSKKISVGS